MMPFKFEDYLNGNLPEPERRALEQHLEDDPALRAQLQEEAELLARLKGQMLRERVEAAMKTGGEAPPSVRYPRWWIWAALAILLAALLAWWTIDRPAPNTSREAPAQEQSTETGQEEEGAMPQEEPLVEEAPQGPVAQRTNPSPSAETPKSGLRGLGDAPASSPGKAAARQLQLREGAFPPLYRPAVEQARKGRYQEAGEALAALEHKGISGDTLAYLRGFCLLKQEKGLEAARYFVRLETPVGPFAEEAQWGLALSWLLAGEEAWAEEQLQAISGQPEHPRAAAAAALLEKLAADQH